MFNLVIFGPPGSGKGTQSDKIIEKYQLKHLSTGDLLRAEKRSGSELGKDIQRIIDNGELVPDAMVQQMVKAFVEKNKDANGFIFDGFPRTVQQAQWLDQMLPDFNTSVSLMLSLDVEEDELKKRLLSRGAVSGRADDQNVSIIENRIQVYHHQTIPVMDFYKKQMKYAKVEGVGDIDDIFKRVCLTIEKYMK